MIFLYKNQLFPLRCRLGSPWAPCIYPDFERYPPKRFSAITCAIWLRLIFRGRGSAWFFGAHLLFFACPGADFGGRARILDPQVDILARGPFWHPKMVPKKNVCGGMILWWGFRGIPPAQINSMVPGSHMGRLLCPKILLKDKI